MNNNIHMIQETFENGSTHEQVPAVTIIIDGQFKKGLDILLRKSATAKNYTELIHEALMAGLELMIRADQRGAR